MSERPEDSVLHAAPRVNRLSDSIYELYNPGASSRLNVVFFHGLQLSHNSDSHLSTWTSRGSQQEVWPMTWLPEEFPEARILCVNYDSCIRRSAEHGRLDLHNAAEMLMVNLKLARLFQHPTILIGHSYGGLVIKQLCLEVHTWRHWGPDGEDAEVLNCIKGVFFYGTPHHGSSVLSTLTDLKDASPLLDFVHVLCAVSARLHQIFDSLRWTHKWRIAGVGELKPIPTLMPEGESQSVIIVHEASARYGEFTMEQEDHFSLCQPESRFSNTYTRLTEFIRCIDEDIHPLKGMRFFNELHYVPKMAMGLRLKLFETVRNFLGTAPLVGLHGMDGVGKTTLAKLLFNNMCTEFEYTCFISGSKLKGDYQEMKENMYLSMYHYGRKVIRGGKLFRAIKLYGDMIDLTQTKLLFVLDDIVDSHVQFLREISSKFDYVNSRYIVTSQNKNILGRCVVTYHGRHRYFEARVFQVDCLSHENSRELFMTHAFSHSVIEKQLLGIKLRLDIPVEELIDEIVAKCEGLPLTLEVIGSYLKNKRLPIWRECLEALDEAADVVDFNERLWSKLQVSYNRLSFEDQEMFLDAATFFYNSTWNLQAAKSCWNKLYHYGGIGWQNLVHLCLVYDVSEGDYIQMHRQLRSLGLKLASAWGHNRIRRTLTKKNVSPTSTVTNMETKEVIALRLEVSMPLNSTHIFQMQKLRYLDFEELDEAYFVCPSSVILLRLRGEGNSLEDLVDGHLPACLVALDLKAPLNGFPTIVTEIRGLEVMKFEACLFEGLPETFVNFQKLRHLTFSSCNGLRSLPEDFGLLSELRYLELRKCNNFEALPDSFGKLQSLKILIMASLDNLQRLPQDFGALSNLERLVISDAPKISELPDSFYKLDRLRDLHLDNMSSLQALPDSFGYLSKLWRLSMVGCMMREELPDSFGDLPNLTILDIRDCRSAQVYPTSMRVIRRLPRLKYLIVETNYPGSESEGNLSESDLRALWGGGQSSR